MTSPSAAASSSSEGSPFDPDVDVEFLHSHVIPADRMRVHFSSLFNERLPPSPYDAQIEQVWESRCQENKTLFNASKFRFHSSSFENDALTINLGVTCYKNFIGTNMASNASELARLGRCYLSDPVGVGNFVITSDSFVIVTKRSEFCAEAPGCWDIPGGHPEPSVIGLNVNGDYSNEEDTLNATVVEEIVVSTLRETQDEVNIPMEQLRMIGCLGIARNTTTCGRPSIEFLVECTLSSAEIRRLYCKGTQAEADETTAIKFIPLNDMATLKQQPLWQSLAPSAKGCFEFYIRLFHTSHNPSGAFY